MPYANQHVATLFFLYLVILFRRAVLSLSLAGFIFAFLLRASLPAALPEIVAAWLQFGMSGRSQPRSRRSAAAKLAYSCAIMREAVIL